MLIYLAFTAGSDLSKGWPIPTATDIAFALGVLAVFGRGLPNRLRVFLLALAVLDDLIAILIIAIFFTADPDLLSLGLAVITVAAFGILSRLLRGRMRWPIGVLMVLVACLTWWLVWDSGVHATIAGVALGLVMARNPAGRVAHVLEPWSNGLILPLFAFSAALVVIPAGVARRAVARLLGHPRRPPGRQARRHHPRRLARLPHQSESRARPHPAGRSPHDRRPRRHRLHGVAAHERTRLRRHRHRASARGRIAVLLGSAVSIVGAGFAVSGLARRYRRQHPHPDTRSHSHPGPHPGPHSAPPTS